MIFPSFYFELELNILKFSQFGIKQRIQIIFLIYPFTKLALKGL